MKSSTATGIAILLLSLIVIAAYVAAWNLMGFVLATEGVRETVRFFFALIVGTAVLQVFFGFIGSLSQ